MSVYRIRTCDICGQEMCRHQSLTVKQWFSGCGDSWSKRLDICDKCKDKMFEWVKQNRQNSTAN